jgi:hypothetical protein
MVLSEISLRRLFLRAGRDEGDTMYHHRIFEAGGILAEKIFIDIGVINFFD